jgi:hypothetical protein
MSKEKLEKLLGPSERPSEGSFYMLASGQCGNGWAGLEVEFDKEKVSRWREVWWLTPAMHSAPWVTENMVYDFDFSSSRTNEDEPLLKLYSKRSS